MLAMVRGIWPEKPLLERFMDDIMYAVCRDPKARLKLNTSHVLQVTTPEMVLEISSVEMCSANETSHLRNCRVHKLTENQSAGKC